MNWTAGEVRALRCRLGWSQAEMARNLKLDLAALASVEAGSTQMPTELRGSLLRILQQAEMNAERVHRRPIADVMMKDRGLSQIHDFEVIESLVEAKAKGLAGQA